ncbi:MAG: HupE/UreJ family protein [Gammaproteobacteria bacterium]
MTKSGSMGIATLAGGLALLASGPALAHTGHGDAHGVLTGLAHPFSGLDHILAMVAVGLWAAQMGRQALWLLPLVFPAVMALGGAAGMAGWALPGIEVGIALSSVVLGLMVLGKVQLPALAASLLVGVLAVFHGFAHGAELPASTSGLQYAAGFVIGTLVLHLIGAGVGSVHRNKAMEVVLRGLGAGIAAGGALFLSAAAG